MKNQKGLDYRLLIGVLLFLLLALIYFGRQSGSTYTQSDISALMKFNASEFGCFQANIFKQDAILKIGCLSYESEGCTDGVKNDMCLFKKDHSASKFDKVITYFPQFDGVKIELEPERQECVNETVEKIITCNGVYDCYNRGEPLSLCVKKLCEITIDNFTRCQTIPAVTRQINPWAAGENDLATEFCKMQTLELIDGIWCVASVDPCSYVVEVDGEIDGIRIYRNIIDNSLCDLYGRKPDCFKFNETKLFTRGEVVEGRKFCTTIFGSKMEVDRNQECMFFSYQKLIRCDSDDGTTKGFGDVLK